MAAEKSAPKQAHRAEEWVESTSSKVAINWLVFVASSPTGIPVGGAPPAVSHSPPRKLMN